MAADGALVVVPLVVVLAVGVAEGVALGDEVVDLGPEVVPGLEELLHIAALVGLLVVDGLEGGGLVVDDRLDGVDLLVLGVELGLEGLLLVAGGVELVVLGFDGGHRLLGRFQGINVLDEALLFRQAHRRGLLPLVQAGNLGLDLLQVAELAHRRLGRLAFVLELVVGVSGRVELRPQGLLFVDQVALLAAKLLELVLGGLGGRVAPLAGEVALDLGLEGLPLGLEGVDLGVDGADLLLVVVLGGPGDVGDGLRQIVELLDGRLVLLLLVVVVLAALAVLLVSRRLVTGGGGGLVVVIVALGGGRGGGSLGLLGSSRGSGGSLFGAHLGYDLFMFQKRYCM